MLQLWEVLAYVRLMDGTYTGEMYIFCVRATLEESRSVAANVMEYKQDLWYSLWLIEE